MEKLINAYEITEDYKEAHKIALRLAKKKYGLEKYLEAGIEEIK